MLQDYQQQSAAVYMSDSRSSEASVNRTIYTHMLGDYHPPPASWEYEDLLLSSWGVGIFIQFHACNSAIEALQTMVWLLQEQWAWKGCDWSGSLPRSQANSLMGAQPASLLSVQESSFGSLSGDSSSSGETAARFGTDSVQVTPVCSQQYKQTSLLERLLQHTWSWLFIHYIALFLHVSPFHSPLPHQPFIAKHATPPLCPKLSLFLCSFPHKRISLSPVSDSNVPLKTLWSECFLLDTQ